MIVIHGWCTRLCNCYVVHLTYDACTASGNTNALVGFVCGESARLLREQTRDASDPVAARGKWLEQRIVVMSTVDAADVPAALAYRELDWQHEKYTDGCVNSTKPGGWLTRLRGVDDESVEFVNYYFLNVFRFFYIRLHVYLCVRMCDFQSNLKDRLVGQISVDRVDVCCGPVPSVRCTGTDTLTALSSRPSWRRSWRFTHSLTCTALHQRATNASWYV